MIITWVMVGVVSLLLLATAILKLSGNEGAVKQFEKFNLAGYIIPIGALEAFCTILFIIPKTSTMGTLLLSAYFGGAIAIELAAGGQFVFPFFVLVVIWVTSFIRNPEMFDKLLK